MGTQNAVEDFTRHAPGFDVVMISNMDGRAEHDLEEGVVRGFALGLIDIPFAPSIYNHAEVQTAGDIQGAVRFLRTGSLRFDAEIQDFHERKLDERRRVEGFTGRNRDYLLVESDVLRVPRELYRAWPLDSMATDPTFASLPAEADPAVLAFGKG